MRNIRAKVFIFLFLYLCAFVVPAQAECANNGFPVARIAHAGGGIDGKSYTNSYEALNHNLSRGFTYFELDFSFTFDKQLVCLHDWNESFKQTFGTTTSRPVTYREFQVLAEKYSKYRNCTLEGVSRWLADNPDAYIVTDVKDNNLEALKMISRLVPEAGKRFIPQIYQPESYRKVKALGYEKVIWTLYRFQGSTEDVLAWSDKIKGAWAITMHKYLAEGRLPEALCEKGIPSYVHTVNREGVRKKYMGKKYVSEIYTDFLVPD